ncbi:MAG: hypothetical protein Q9167_003259 [Letrouitia subvulpina]
MSSDETSFLVVPLNLLPSERVDGATHESIEEEKRLIRERIFNKSNSELSAEDMVLLRALGSDLNINTFALNFRYSDGTVNNDVEEANYLNKRVVELLSVDTPEDDPTKIPFFLTSTVFEHAMYGKCAQHFKKRLGLTEDELDLFVLRNVLMTPFPTEGNFIGKLAGIFQEIVEKEVEVCRKRNETKENHHSFIMQGTESIYLVHRAMFYLASRRRQLIASAVLDKDSLKAYQEAKKANPQETFFLSTQGKEDLDATMLNDGQFEAVITAKSGKTIKTGVTVSSFKALKDRPLNSKYRDPAYPSGHMPFYLYGSGAEFHMDHMLLRAPNCQLSASNIKIFLNENVTEDHFRDGCLLFAHNVEEEAMQPFLPTSELVGGSGPTSKKNFFFKSGKKFQISVFKDKYSYKAGGPGLANVDYGDRLATGEMVLGTEGEVWVDSETVNRDPFARRPPVNDWIDEFNKIGEELK